jgi:hypothetical protein
VAEVERTPENDGVYRAIRAEIQFELTLINARVNWLVASQAFLFVPLTVGTRGSALADSLFYPLIPLLGIILCLLVLLATLAAVWRSRQWRAKGEQGAYRGLGEEGRFSVVAPRTPAIPALGLAGSLGVPVVLALTWLYLMIAPPSLS